MRKSIRTHRASAAGVSENDGVVDGAGAWADGCWRERETVVPGNRRLLLPESTGGSGVYGVCAVGADADVEVVVALVGSAAVRTVIIPVGVAAVAVSVPVVVAGVGVVNPGVSVVVTDELHLPLRRALRGSLQMQNASMNSPPDLRVRKDFWLTGMKLPIAKTTSTAAAMRIILNAVFLEDWSERETVAKNEGGAALRENTAFWLDDYHVLERIFIHAHAQ